MTGFKYRLENETNIQFFDRLGKEHKQKVNHMEQQTLRQASVDYVQARVRNIAELERVDIGRPIETKTFGQGDTAFTNDVITVDGEDFRVPVSVIQQLQALLLKYDFEFFSVVKTGTTIKDTKYSVVPELKK